MILLYFFKRLLWQCGICLNVNRNIMFKDWWCITQGEKGFITLHGILLLSGSSKQHSSVCPADNISSSSCYWESEFLRGSKPNPPLWITTPTHSLMHYVINIENNIMGIKLFLTVSSGSSSLHGFIALSNFNYLHWNFPCSCSASGWHFIFFLAGGGFFFGGVFFLVINVLTVWPFLKKEMEENKLLF